MQTENPGLDIALWNQPRNLLMLNINALFSTILQGLIELPPSILNRMSVCIDYYDQRSLGVTAAVHVHFLDKRFPHPTFGVPLARGRTLNPHVAVSHPALFEISAGKHFMMGVFQNHDDIDPR
jgi:hypothetical protein